MNTTLVTEILDYLSPLLVRAGQYACQVQSKVAKQPPKEGYENLFSTALTDADLSIQAFIEVALLAQFPQISFFGEEHAQSLNMKYFPANAELCVYLDPVDGTRFFQDNLARFNVIATVADQDQILGAACYVPKFDRFFRAEKNRGATVQNSQEALTAGKQQSLNLSDNPACIVTYDFPFVQKSLGDSFEVIDIASAYTPEKGCLSLNSILLRECSALIGREGGLIDWGAIAFLAQEAGTLVTDFKGKHLPQPSELIDNCYPELLVCKDWETQQKILEGLADYK